MNTRQLDRRPRTEDGAQARAGRRPTPLGAVALTLALAAVALTAYRLVAAPGDAGDSLGNLLTSAAMAFACAGFITAALRCTGDARRSWSWIAAGGIVYLLGELTWALEVALGPEPSGNSLADGFWLAALPLLFVGLLIRARESTPISARGEGLLDSLIVIGLFAVVIGRFVLGGLFDPGVPASETAVGLAYPAADAALLWMLLRGIYRTNSRWDSEQALLATGLLALLVGDVLWALDADTAVAFSDLAYTATGVALGGAGFAAARAARRGAVPETLTNPLRPLVIDLMPYIAGIAVAAVAFSLDLSGKQNDIVTLAAAGVLLLVLARLAMAVRQNRRLREAAEERAVFDALTGLRNHRYFRERLDEELARAGRAGSSVGMLAIDIDRFKDVNDTIGHLGGDRLLSEMGSVLRTNARPSDTPCRVGGDEFAVILPEVDGESLAAVAERIHAAAAEIRLASSDSVEGGYLPVSISIGACLYPEAAADERSLIENADMALYQSKREGRGRVTVFEPGAAGPTGPDEALVEAERKIAERELDLTRVFGAAPDPLLVLSPVGQILDANSAACRVTGLSTAQMRERAIWDFLPEREAERVARMLTGESVEPAEAGAVEITLPDGASRWLEFTSTDFPPDRLLLALRDVTDQRAAVEQLELSEKKFHALFESAADAIYVLDDEGTITDANGAAVELSGTTRDQLIGSGAGDLVGAEQREELAKLMQELLTGQRAQGIFEATWPDGSRRAVQFSSVANFIPGRHLSIVRDVTELVRAQRAAAERERLLERGRAGAAGDYR